MSKVTHLAAGSAQPFRRQTQHRATSTGSTVPVSSWLVWPQKPSITAPTPKALAALASAMVRTLAEAQTELAAKIRNSR